MTNTNAPGKVRDSMKSGVEARPPRRKRKKGLSLTEDEVLRLFAAAGERSAADSALLMTIYALALRASEAANIRRADVSLDHGRISIHVLKRSKIKRDQKTKEVLREAKPPPIEEVALDPTLVEVLRRHIAVSPASEWLFPHPRDPRLPTTRGLIQYAYHCAAVKIGLDPNGYVWHPHLLRASRATHKAKQLANTPGMSPVEAVNHIQETLRHATPTMAFTYVRLTSSSRAAAQQADADLLQRMLGGK